MVKKIRQPNRWLSSGGLALLHNHRRWRNAANQIDHRLADFSPVEHSALRQSLTPAPVDKQAVPGSPESM